MPHSTWDNHFSGDKIMEYACFFKYVVAGKDVSADEEKKVTMQHFNHERIILV